MNWKTLTCLGACAATSLAHAISPAQLHKELSKGGKLTIIDVRNTDVYQQAHIPGAISVPAALCSSKKLPPLGRVIAYDGGLGNNIIESAVAELNAKPGIRAEILEGGFAAWQALKLGDTRGRGVEKEMLPMVTYQQLKTNQTDEIVLVDLRKAGPAAPGAKANEKAAPLTDLHSAFPRARVEKSPFNIQGTKKGTSGETLPPLLVLIDTGDGASDEMVRMLRANGITRCVVLAGGEESVAREGQPGLKRSGGTVPVVTPTTTTSN
jgi:rhodanese-related sulfurtransferase